MPLSIVPLDCGRLPGVERSMHQYLTGFGEKLSVAIVAWLIVGGEFPVVVDAGPGNPELVRERFGRELQQSAEQLPRAAVERAGVDPDSVALVVLTHLHWDHALGLELDPFPNAKAIVQRRELDYAASPYPPHAPIYDEMVVQKALAREYKNLATVDGDVTIADGVRVLLTPGHTPGLQAVLVDTGELVYAIASDNVPLESSWGGPGRDDWIPTGIHVSLDDCYRSMARLAAEADVVLPSHDPCVLDWTPLPDGGPRLGARSWT
jgi:N-acyl homoserine lactone hydrolase